VSDHGARTPAAIAGVEDHARSLTELAELLETLKSTDPLPADVRGARVGYTHVIPFITTDSSRSNGSQGH